MCVFETYSSVIWAEIVAATFEIYGKKLAAGGRGGGHIENEERPGTPLSSQLHLPTSRSYILRSAVLESFPGDHTYSITLVH